LAEISRVVDEYRRLSHLNIKSILILVDTIESTSHSIINMLLYIINVIDNINIIADREYIIVGIA